MISSVQLCLWGDSDALPNTTKWNDTDSHPVCVYFGCGLCRRHRSVVRSVSAPHCVKSTQFLRILCFSMSHTSFCARMTAWSTFYNCYLRLRLHQKVTEFRGSHPPLSDWLVNSPVKTSFSLLVSHRFLIGRCVPSLHHSGIRNLIIIMFVPNIFPNKPTHLFFRRTVFHFPYFYFTYHHFFLIKFFYFFFF